MPTEMRAIAARVMAGGGSNSEIAMAIGWTRVDTNWHGTIMRNPEGFADYIPDFLDDLNAADALFAPLRERGWVVTMTAKKSGCWADAELPTDAPGRMRELSTAPTEPRARTALALLCMAAEMESTP